METKSKMRNRRDKQGRQGTINSQEVEIRK